MEALKPPNKLTRAPNKLMSLVFMAQSKLDKKYIHIFVLKVPNSWVKIIAFAINASFLYIF